MIDIRPATDRMASLIEIVSEDQFGLPTPCPEAGVGDLIDHVGALTKGFIAVARKNVDGTEAPVKPDAANLEVGWRDRVVRDLATLAETWRDSAAWEGMTSAAGVALPGHVAGLVALDELVVHGWDIAVAIGQPYTPSVEDVEAAMSFVAAFDAPRDGNLFGPAVPVPDDAPALDRLLGLTGRDPEWRSSAR
jgi:uncharacterized protein (TIGR03086 family)